MSWELSSINVKSDKYKPRYGTHGGSTLMKSQEKKTNFLFEIYFVFLLR
jgi:hypothetical protein